MKEAANVTTNRMVESEVLKTADPIMGEAKSARSRPGPARESSRRRVVLATAPAFEGSWLPMLEEMNRVAAAGRESWVRVVKTESAAASIDTSPIWARLRIRMSTT